MRIISDTKENDIATKTVQEIYDDILKQIELKRIK